MKLIMKLKGRDPLIWVTIIQWIQAHGSLVTFSAKLRPTSPFTQVANLQRLN